MFKKLSLALLLTVALVLAGCATEPASSGKLKIGSMPRVFDMIAYVAQQEGLFDKQGIEVEIVPFRSTLEMNTALITGALDGIIQDAFEAVNLNKDAQKAKLVGSSVMPRMFEVVVSTGSGITGVDGLKGKEIATATNTVMDYALTRLLQANGLSSNSMGKVNIPSLPLRLEALNQGKVPAAILTPPLSDVAIANGGKLIISDAKEPFAGPGLVFSLAALKNKSKTIDRFIQAWQQSVELINANPGKYQGVLNKVAFVPESVSLKVPVFPRLGLPSQAEVTSVVTWFIAVGITSQPVTYQDIVETKYLR